MADPVLGFDSTAVNKIDKTLDILEFIFYRNDRMIKKKINTVISNGSEFLEVNKTR